MGAADVAGVHEADIAGSVIALIHGMYDGARAVRAASRPLVSPAARPVHPHRYTVGGMRAELNFEAAKGEQWRFLWIRTSEERPSFQVRVAVELDPVLHPVRRSPLAHRILMGVPGFLDVAGDPQSLDFRCMDGRVLHVSFDDSGGLQMEADGNVSRIEPTFDEPPEGSPPGAPRRSFLPIPSQWPMAEIVAVLESIGDWKLGKMPVRNSVFTLDEGLGADLDSLLSTVAEGCARVSDAMQLRMGDPSGEDSFDIAAFSATVRTYLENQGRQVRVRATESSQQLDLMLVPGALRADGHSLVTFDLPDFLVQGALHDRFVRAVHAGRDRIRRALENRRAWAQRDARPDVSQLDRLLDPSRLAGSAVVIRIAYDDTDLVLLRSPVQEDPLGLLLEARFVKQDDASVILDPDEDIRLVAHLKDRVWHGTMYGNLPNERDQLKAPYYFVRLLRTLHALQKCIAAEAGQSGEQT